VFEVLHKGKFVFNSFMKKTNYLAFLKDSQYL